MMRYISVPYSRADSGKGIGQNRMSAPFAAVTQKARLGVYRAGCSRAIPCAGAQEYRL